MSTPDYRIQLDTVVQDYDGKTCWTQARAAAVPRAGCPSLLLITMQRLLLTGSDIFSGVHEIQSADLGCTWTAPKLVPTLDRQRQPDGSEIGIGNLWPKWHAATERVLNIGNLIHYVDEKHPDLEFGSSVAYSVWNPDSQNWSAGATLPRLEDDSDFSQSACCVQRLDLPDGDILLPIYARPGPKQPAIVKVLRCRFDGSTLSAVESGRPLRLDTQRGLLEPSLTVYRGRYFLTLRHDLTAYVTTSEDGLNYGPIQEWLWDDGTELGSYNTQAHWVTHSDGLFLVYTRRGANNDHVFRHRAPLFIAEVDPKTLRVRRATERVLIPERGARYGNFGICHVSEHETWVVETEWMQRPPEEPVIPIENRWSAAGRVYAARIQWQTPNLDWDKV